MTEKRFTKQEVYEGINRYRINESNFIVEILDDGIPMHYSTIVNRLNEQDKTITRLEKENEQLKIRFNEEREKSLKFCRNIDTLTIENEHLKNHIQELQNHLKRLENENEQIKQVIKEAYETERTHIGKSVLKQLLNNIGEI